MNRIWAERDIFTTGKETCPNINLLYVLSDIRGLEIFL